MQSDLFAIVFSNIQLQRRKFRGQTFNERTAPKSEAVIEILLKDERCFVALEIYGS